MKFDIEGRLPGLNEMIEAAKGHFGAYASMKQTYTDMVAWLAKKLPKYQQVNITITWYEPNEKRDPDNIMAGQKFIMDGLVTAGTIPNDSQRHIKGIVHRFRVDKENPRVEVEIVDIEKCANALDGQELID
jgi:Holliday junction resolvase RusA-like endonuclease